MPVQLGSTPAISPGNSERRQLSQVKHQVRIRLEMPILFPQYANRYSTETKHAFYKLVEEWESFPYFYLGCPGMEAWEMFPAEFTD